MLVEGLTGRRQVRANLLNLKGARYVVSWMDGTDIQEGDRLTYSSHKYTVHDVLDDTTRPTGKYYTGTLVRVVETT